MLHPPQKINPFLKIQALQNIRTDGLKNPLVQFCPAFIMTWISHPTARGYGC